MPKNEEQSRILEELSSLIPEEMKLIADIVSIERRYTYGADTAQPAKRQKEIGDFLERHLTSRLT